MTSSVAIDEDVYLALAENAKKRCQSVDELAAPILRNWLSTCKTASPSDRPRFEQKTFHMGRPLIDLTNASQTLADLEDQEIIERLRRSE